MSKLVSVFVCDSNNYGISGCKVSLYTGEETRTDSNGKATLIANDSSCTVYVDGTEVYDGYVSNLPSPIIYKRS